MTVSDVLLEPRMTSSNGRDGPIKLLIVDDHRMVGESLRAALDRFVDIEVVGLAFDADAAIQSCATRQADVVLLDYKLSGRHGPDVAGELLVQRPGLGILMMTASASVRAVSAAIEGGCLGVVTRDDCLVDVAGAVRDAARGRAHISAEMVGKLVPRLGRSVGPNLELSYREIEVLELIGDGHTGPAIAAALHLSHHTVRNHTSSILKKLGVHSRMNAVLLARSLALIGDPG